MRRLAGICPLGSLNLICTFSQRVLDASSWVFLYVVQFQHAWISISFPLILANREKKIFYLVHWFKGEIDHSLEICGHDVD